MNTESNSNVHLAAPRTERATVSKAHGITRVSLAKVGGSHLSEAANEQPTSLRPVSDNQGANHATTKRDDEIELSLTRRRPQDDGLTQQATNSTCVTARSDGHFITRRKQGFGPGASYTPVCSCGWTGRTEHEWDDYCFTRLSQQEGHHMKGGVL